jgi:23S rRNA pseudouridine1911/1915/1917 synthase
MSELYSLHRLTLKAPGEPLFAALSAAIPSLSRRQAREAISAGLVKVDGALVAEPKATLADSASVVCDLRHGIAKIRHAQKHGAATTAEERPFTIVYEDADIVIVNKAAGIISAPVNKGEHGHVGELLRHYWRKKGRDARFIGTVHRLDRDTSGCLCFALTREAQRLILPQFASHSAARTYRCLVMGQPRQDSDRISGKLGRGHDGRRSVVDEDEPGKEAVSHFTVLNRFARGAELEVRLETGRTHQIRVHLAAIGCPVYGDRVYATRFKPKDPKLVLPKSPRLMLHAHALSLDQPTSGRRVEAVAPPPPVFADFITLLRT